MKRDAWILPLMLLAAAAGIAAWLYVERPKAPPKAADEAKKEAVPAEVQRPPEILAGSTSCRECHEAFYKLWANSRHGLAMQPYTPTFAKANFFESRGEIKIAMLHTAGADRRRRLDRRKVRRGREEISNRPRPGREDVYYFLTLLDHGRLQTLPIGYDVSTKTWFDVAKSGVRHFVEGDDAALDWRHSAYTFNTSCYSCHVSQLSRNFDLASKTYHTVWAEPGISCETCHGPAVEHVRVCKAAPKDKPPQDIKIIRMKGMAIGPQNDACCTCHAKMSPVSTSYMPGDRFFDHYDLVTLDNPDFYPDGRDLGENYTMTSWRMSPCAASGKLACVHCHTASGRYRFNENPNQACAPCHEDKIAHAAEHTHHKADGPGGRCVACHMPTSGFAAMRRTDHSMRPPMPAATIAFKSPNACDSCHKDAAKDAAGVAAWSDQWVRKWRKRDYQAATLHWAGLIDAAHKGQWARLTEMCNELTKKDRQEVVAASLARLLRTCDDPRRLPALLAAAKDDSPLVRAAAVEALGMARGEGVAAALAAACGDDYRLVRVRAAAVLGGYPPAALADANPLAIQIATDEYLTSLRPPGPLGLALQSGKLLPGGRQSGGGGAGVRDGRRVGAGRVDALRQRLDRLRPARPQGRRGEGPSRGARDRPAKRRGQPEPRHVARRGLALCGGGGGVSRGPEARAEPGPRGLQPQRVACPGSSRRGGRLGPGRLPRQSDWQVRARAWRSICIARARRTRRFRSFAT